MRKFYFLTAIMFIARIFFAQNMPPQCPSNLTAPADNCIDACVYCQFNGIQSSSTPYTPASVTGFCGTIENKQWLAFVASKDTNATFSATPLSCTNGDGLQVALFTDCASAPIACYGGTSGGQSIPAALTSAVVAGQTYYLMIDGFAGDQCTFVITVNPVEIFQSFPLSNLDPIQGADTVCQHSTAVYSVPALSSAAFYTWTAPNQALINGQISPVQISALQGNQVTVTFGNVGGNVCVEASNSCHKTPIVCKKVAMRNVNAPSTTLPTVKVCANELPYYLPWGDSVLASGTYVKSLQAVNGCDSTVIQPVTVLPNYTSTNITTYATCAGSRSLPTENGFQNRVTIRLIIRL